MEVKRGFQRGLFTGPNPTDHGKRHILVDRLGAAISFVISQSGTQDSKLLSSTLNKFRIYKNRKFLRPEILSLDKAYIGQQIKNDLRKRKIRYTL